MDNTGSSEKWSPTSTGRRSFLKGAVAVSAATAVWTVLSGCGKNTGNTTVSPEVAETDPLQLNNFRMLLIHANWARHIAAKNVGKAYFSKKGDYDGAVFKLHGIVLARSAILNSLKEYYPNENLYSQGEERMEAALDELIPKLVIGDPYSSKRSDFLMAMNARLIWDEQKEKWFKAFPELREIAENAKKEQK